MPTTTNPRPVRELLDYLAKHAARCRAAGWLGSLFHVNVSADIAQDCAALAHKAECDDNEAGAIILGVLADGKVTDAEVPLLKKALGHVQASANADHNLTA